MKHLFLVLVAAWTFAAVTAGATGPSIVTEPQSVTNNNGSAASFTVLATNAASYQWYFQGSNVVSGQTNATLNLDDLTTNDAGSYTVVVTSSNSISVTSAPPAVLTIVQGTILQWTISTYPNGGTSNFLVQLFDHDKPATVENFLHYVSSGAYSNMFFDRDVAGFVLQGGDEVSADRTNSLFNFTPISPGTNFPSQVENEYGVGPVIHNTFGTLAMALQSGDTNSASGAFFFNLVDNSSSLDVQDFTVFGRILYGTNSGSNVLQYFNTLSAPSNGIVSYTTGESIIPTLPVNYAGAKAPGDSNLFYCDFAFISPTNPPTDTIPPTISFTSPSPDALFTNVTTVNFTGTAADNVAVAEVYTIVYALTGLYAGNNSGTNAVVGTTDWYSGIQSLVPGVYQVTGYAQDAEGNVSLPATLYFTNFAVLTLITNQNGVMTTNQQNLLAGQQYSFTAEPGPGEAFVNWQLQGAVSLDPVQTITAETNLTLEVTYSSTNLPPGLAITNPAAGAVVQTTNYSLTISGTLPSSVTVTNVSVQLFSQSNAVTAALPAVISGTNWALTESNLLGGPYTVVVQAEDTAGQYGVVTENFTALAPAAIVSEPVSVTVNTGSSADFSVTASNALSYQWQLLGAGPVAGATNATLALDNVSSNQSGSSYQVVVTAPDGETVTSSPVTLTVVQGTIVQLTISKYPGGGSNYVTVELFDHDKPATVENFIHYIRAGAYSNMFFDTDNGAVLAGGEFVTPGRTTNALQVESVSTGTNVFPAQIINEFNLGPRISNESGTLASVSSGAPGTPGGAFFFNLTNNSGTLDGQDFAVFGRIISGSNVLQDFSALTIGNGIYKDTNDDLPFLPVNYSGTNAPQNDNVFYCDFTFETTPPVVTNLPMVSIAFPTPDEVLTNAGDVNVTGTASDTAGLADVFVVLTTLAGNNAGQTETNIAAGGTNWSANFGNFQPGIFKLTAYAQDGAGNLSAPATEYFTNLAQLTIITNVDGQLTYGAAQYLVPGQMYSLTSAPASGQQFYGWTVNGNTSLNPVQTGTVTGNLTLTVMYVTTNFNAGLAITDPVSGGGAIAIQYVLTVSGTIASTNVANLTCQFFQNSNSVRAALHATIAGTNWSVAVTGLGNGPYTVVALAANAAGAGSIASANFNLTNMERLAINVVGKGSVTGNPGALVPPGTYTVKAAPSAGQIFYSWNNGVVTTLNPTYKFQVVSNLTLTATFLPEDASLSGLTVTYPPANAMLTNGTFIITGGLPASLTNLTYQLFVQSNALAASPQPVALGVAGTKWSLPVSNLNAGAYTVLAAGYDAHGNSRLVSRSFNLLAKLAVNVVGKGTVTAGLNGSYRQVGKSYAIIAKPASGQIFAYWTGDVQYPSSATTTFIMESNTALTATFSSNLFPGVAGTYTGLFLDPSNPSPTNAGFITVSITASGRFSGNLMFPSITYPISYLFPYNGSTQLEAPNTFDSNTLALVMNLDLTNGTGAITGLVADETANGSLVWLSSLVLNRSATSLAGTNAPGAGNYVLLEQFEDSTNEVDPVGYAAVSLSAGGAVALGGALPDNTAISESAKISTNGVWPVYIVPASYKKKGMIIGWQTNTPSGTSTGELFWCKPGAAFATNLLSIGAAYSAPATNSNYRMIVGGEASYPLPTGPTVHFVSQAPLEQVSILPTGVLSGYIEVNDTKFAFKGAFVNPTEGGAGFIIGTNSQFEGFKILPPPP